MDRRSARIEQVYRHRYVGFRNALATITGSQDSADDVVQEAFARALAARKQFRGGSLEAWIWQIAFRTALEVARRQRRTFCDDDEAAELPAPELAGLDRDPDLARALRALSPRRRMIVFLRYFADLPHAEIAQTCGVSEGTVAATLAQAKQHLARTLEPSNLRPRDGMTTNAPTGASR